MDPVLHRVPVSTRGMLVHELGAAQHMYSLPEVAQHDAQSMMWVVFGCVEKRVVVADMSCFCA